MSTPARTIPVAKTCPLTTKIRGSVTTKIRVEVTPEFDEAHADHLLVPVRCVLLLSKDRTEIEAEGESDIETADRPPCRVRSGSHAHGAHRRRIRGVRTPRNADGSTGAPRAAAQGGYRLLRRRAPGAHRHRLEADYRSDGCRGCDGGARSGASGADAVSYTHLRAHE